MKYYKNWMLLMLVLLLSGCIANKYIEHKQYLLDVPDASKKARISYQCSLFVDRVTAISPFDRLDFLYRIKSGGYLIDYYHGFFALPAGQFDEILKASLKKHAHFNSNYDKLIIPSYRLAVELAELYADYRDHNNPTAVVAMRFVLTKSVEDKVIVVVDKLLRSSIYLKAKNTESLLQGWNNGIRNIMQQGIQILNGKISC